MVAKHCLLLSFVVLEPESSQIIAKVSHECRTWFIMCVLISKHTQTSAIHVTPAGAPVVAAMASAPHGMVHEGGHNRGDNDNDNDRQMNASVHTWTLAICATAGAGVGVGVAAAAAGTTLRTNKGQHEPSERDNGSSSCSNYNNSGDSSSLPPYLFISPLSKYEHTVSHL